MDLNSDFISSWYRPFIDCCWHYEIKAENSTFQAAANNYVKAGSMNLTESRDIFLYNTMTKTKKEKNDSSSGGGGSSTHTTSSGSTAGGGGGKF